MFVVRSLYLSTFWSHGYSFSFYIYVNLRKFAK